MLYYNTKKMRHLYLAAELLALLFFTALFSCTQEETKEPCEGIGKLFVSNKTDSAIRVEIVEDHNTFTVQENYIEYVPLAGDNQYQVIVQGRTTQIDTTLLLPTCGKIDLIILP